MIFVDTGGWFAQAIVTDPDHQAAVDWFAANRAPLVTTDWVIGETLTLFRARGQNAMAQRWGGLAFGGTLCRVHYLTRTDLLDAWDTFHRFADKDWSFTDCTSRAVMLRLGVAQAVSFDKHFRQFGTVAVVP